MNYKKPRCAILLAGGLGTRLRSVVADVPKPMASVQGRPFLSYILDYWKSQGIERFIFCLGYKYQIIIDYYGNEFKGCSIDYSIEDMPLGTGGAVIQAVNKFHLLEPFLLLNGDTFFEVNLEELHKFATKKNADWCFSLFENSDTSRYLSIGLNSNDVLDFPELTSKNAILDKSNVLDRSNINLASNDSYRYGNGGVYWINPKVFEPFSMESKNYISLEKDIFPRGLQFGQSFFGLKFPNTFIDIGLPEDYYRSQSMQCFNEK